MSASWAISVGGHLERRRQRWRRRRDVDINTWDVCLASAVSQVALCGTLTECTDQPRFVKRWFA